MFEKEFVLSLGGSVVAPSKPVKGVDVEFLRRFERFVRRWVKEKRVRFFMVVGGGFPAREYRDAAKEAAGVDLTDEDLDWLGIHASRLNAHLLRTIFRDVAYKRILTSYERRDERIGEEPIVVGGGWKPGWSTDYCAASLARLYGIKRVVNLSNIAQVYDKDPAKFEDAKPLERVSWEAFFKLVGDKWVPGLNVPFDPIASRLAAEEGMEVVVCAGKDLENLEKVLLGERFVGTVIGG